MVFLAKALLFDMDGVLLHSAPSVEKSWRTWAAMHGFDPVHVIEQAHGRRSIETIRAVAPELDAEKENIVIERIEIENKEGVVALLGVLDLLSTLPKDRFAIVTSATLPLAIARLGYAGIPVPANIITADDVIHGKPSAEPYQKGAALLGFTAADCLVFEDTPAGIAAGHAARAKAIALQGTYPVAALQAAKADAIIASLTSVRAKFQDGTLHLDVTPL